MTRLPADQPKRKWRFSLGGLLCLQVALAPLFLGLGIGVQIWQESRPPRQSSLPVGLIVIWALPALYAGILSAMSMRSADWHPQAVCASKHAMRGLLFGVLYAPLMLGGAMATPLAGAVLDFDLWGLFQFACFTAGYALFTGGEGWVVGALIGLARCRCDKTKA